MKKFKVLLSVLIAACLCICSVTGAFAYTVETPSGDYTFFMPGDVDSSKNVDINDASLIQMHIANVKSIDEEGLKVADYDGDGVVSINDATSIQEMLANYEDYKCVCTADEAYTKYTELYGTPPKNCEKIEYKELINDKNVVLSSRVSDGLYVALIRSEEEFFGLFKAYSPDFDDEFFEENALVVWLAQNFRCRIEQTLRYVGVKDDVLYIEVETVEILQERNESPSYWQLFCKVNKDDVSGVENIYASPSYAGLIDP